MDRSKPLLSGSDPLWRRAAIHRKRDSMMGEWKHGLINWPSLKTRLFEVIDDEPRQNPHAAPAVAGLLEQNPAAPNDECMRFDESFRFGSRLPYWQCSRIFCAAKILNRAQMAFRLPGYASERAKIQECRVEGSGIGFWEKTRCVLPKHAPAGIGID